MTNAPSDLIQQALDIMSSDNGAVRITTQARARMGGGVAQWDGVVQGVINGSFAQLVLAHMRPAGEPVEAGARDHMYVDFDRIIDIQTTQGA